MPVTVKVNGVANSLVHKGSGGVSTATIPDVCKTPSPGGPVPIPYPNISQSATLAKGTTTVKADGGMMIAIKGSEFSLSNGDEPGVVGGVKSSTFMKESTWILYSFDVKMDGQNACRLTDKKFQNHENTVDLGGVLQAIVALFAAGNAQEACRRLLELIEDLIGEGRIGHVRGKRGLEERFKQNTKGGTLGTEGAPNFRPLDAAKDVNSAVAKYFPAGSNAWMRHNMEIFLAQLQLEAALLLYEEKCRGGPPPPVNARDWVDKKIPEPEDYTAELWVPTTAPSSTVSKVGWGLAAVGLSVAAAALLLCPFDGPVGEAAAGSGAAAAWGMALAN
jgi:hypothetical protein